MLLYRHSFYEVIINEEKASCNFGNLLCDLIAMRVYRGALKRFSTIVKN